MQLQWDRKAGQTKADYIDGVDQQTYSSLSMRNATWLGIKSPITYTMNIKSGKDPIVDTGDDEDNNDTLDLSRLKLPLWVIA